MSMRSVLERRARDLSIAVLIAAVTAVAACGGGAGGFGAATGTGPAETAGAATAEGIPYAPTGQDELPAAILGTAPPPQGEPLQYLSDDPATKGYLAVPAGEGAHPALILVHEWDGLNDRVRQVADAFAAEGYVALAADLYEGRTGSTRDENMALVQETRADPAKIVANLNGAAAYLRGRQDVSGRIAVMGWCFGGGIALSYGIEGEAHDATAMFYGQLIRDPAELAKMHHPIYGTFAGLDQGIPKADVDEFVEALRTAGIENDVHVYDEVTHGFWLWVDQDRATREGPALYAWQRRKAFLSKTLG